MTFPNLAYSVVDVSEDILEKVVALEQATEDLAEAVRDGFGGGRPARVPRVAGRIDTLEFVTLACRRVRVAVDEDTSLVLRQSLAFTLLALCGPGGITRGDGHTYTMPQAIALEIGRLRHTPPPSVAAVATYVAGLRKELAHVRTDGKNLILGDVRGGWRLALRDGATVRFP